MTSYQRSIVTIGLSRTVSEINGDSVENRHFFQPPCFYSPAEGVPLGIWYQRQGQKKLEWWSYQMVEKVIRWVLPFW